MLALGTAAPLLLLIALLIDAIVDPARRVLPWLDRLVRIPGENSSWVRARPARERRLAGWGVLGGVLLVALILLFRLQSFVDRFPFGELGIAVLAAPFLPLRGTMRMIGLVRSGLAGGQPGVARDGLGGVMPWRSVAETPEGIGRQAIEAGVLGFAGAFLMPALAFLVMGLPGPVLWRLLVGLGSYNAAVPDRDRQFARAADRTLLLLLYGPGWLAAWLFALAGLLIRVPVRATLAHLERRTRHAEEPLAPAMDAMAHLAHVPLARPVLLRPGGEGGVIFNPGAEPADAAAVATVRTVLYGAIGLIVAVLGLVSALRLLIP
ncbi:hypothetical protein ACRC7T_04590 [Segnochrobactraceae bacterium EtOH-i3]